MLLFVVHAPSLAKGGEPMLNPGDRFVDFELEAHDGSTVRSSDLACEVYLLFYYPKADTPG